VLQVLLRALRDFNLGKLTSDDTSIFVGLLNDLFPQTLELVPRAVDKAFEAKVSAVDWLAGSIDGWHMTYVCC
jgi:dynein heavy chain